MKKVSLVISSYLKDNVLFDVNSELNRDNIFDKYIALRKEFEAHGYDIATSDINKITESMVVIYFDIPHVLPEEDMIDKSFLVLVESELIRPDNFVDCNHKWFNKVFTWHDGLVDEDKYHKLNFAHRFPLTINKDLSKKIKLCTLIAGNKKPVVNSNIELYSSREAAIRWFEKFNPGDFDLYGVGWQSYRFGGFKVLRALNRIPGLGFLYGMATGKNYKSYKGQVENKKKVLERYRFSICYENAKNIPGYITEKIFDSFISGCIPVYLGADNIQDYIPAECFIDKRDFSSYEDLYEFMSSMDDVCYLKYLDNIEVFLNSEDSYPFTSLGFAEIMVSCILRSIK